MSRRLLLLHPRGIFCALSHLGLLCGVNIFAHEDEQPSLETLDAPGKKIVALLRPRARPRRGKHCLSFRASEGLCARKT